MRGFLTFILFFVFFLIFPLAIFSYAITSILSADYIKEELQTSKIYETAAGSIPEIAILPEDLEAQMGEQGKKDFEAFIRKEVTPSFLQSKSETFIDSSFAWLSDETEATPSVDVSDLTRKMDTFFKEKGSTPGEDFIEPSPFKLEATDANLQIKKAYQILQIAPIALAIASGVVLLLIFLLAQGWKSKLRKLSLAFFVPVILSVAPAIVIAFLFQMVIGLATDALKKSEMEELSESVKTLLSGVALDLIKVLAIMLGLALSAAVVFFIASFFVGNKAKEVVAAPINPAPTKVTAN